MKTILSVAVLTGVMTLSSFGQSYYVAGDFNGWNPAGTLMTETSAGSGIWQASFTGLGASLRQEFKITDGAWDGTEFPSANSWLYTDGSGAVTITYDLNTYSDGWVNTTGRIGVNVDPGTWTAVGDWQSAPWSNADPTTAMTDQGGGIYMLQYNVAAAGTYAYKAVDTGSWDAIGSDARSINAGNMSFTTTSANQMVDFYVNALDGTIKATVVPEPATMAIMGFFGLTSLLALRRRK